MSLIRLSSLAALVLSGLLLHAAEAPISKQLPSLRERSSLDAGWHFAFGNASDPQKDFHHGLAYFSYLAKAGYGDGPASPWFDDRSWRLLDLPHDWGVEVPFASDGSHSHGYRALGGHFTAANVGWYRKSIFIPKADLGRRIRLVFDGVFRDSSVWLNGFFLGREPSGYSGFSYDISDYLHYGTDNVISVRVDATMEEGWFYEGAGIYRHTWLEKTSPVHVAEDGVYLTTEVGKEASLVRVRTSVLNEGEAAAALLLELSVVDPAGKVVAQAQSAAITANAGIATDVPSLLTVRQPVLWSIEHPALYKLITVVRKDNAVVDRYESTFGIRTVRFDPNGGFFLNDQHVILKGTNNHQDHAGVGVALPDRLQEYRIERLKEMGSNAYRCSHHPPTPELLAACDRLGMLVIDENRLMGPSPTQLGQLERMIRRDQTHPSVILWSIGNEEWKIEGKEQGARIAASLQAVVHRLDPSRLVTAAVSGGRVEGISTVVDVMGYNYVSMGNVDEHHLQYPRQSAVGTEETTTQATRGIYREDAEHGHMAPRENGTSGGNCEYGWKYYTARPFLAGLFFWTGFDYRGEPTPFGWPAVSSQFGILDTCGFPKDSFYYLKSWWVAQPLVHLFPHWNWPDRLGEPIDVRVDSNCDEVELWLNGKSLGRKPMERNGHLAWSVPYTPGVLRAQGYRAGQESAFDQVETTGPVAAVRLRADRTQLVANRTDLAVVTVELVDATGRVVPTADDEVTFQLEGPGKIIGVGNGDPSSHEADRVIEHVSAIPLQNWRVHPLREEVLTSEIAPDFDDQSWPSAFSGNEIKARLADQKSRVFRSHFESSVIPPEAKVRLFLAGLGDEPAVYLNGQRLSTASSSGKAGTAIELAPDQVRPGNNLVAVVAAPVHGKINAEELAELSGGALQIVTPPPPWKRHAFNGLAQILVQSSDVPGSLLLEATAAQRAAGEVKIMASLPETSGEKARVHAE